MILIDSAHLLIEAASGSLNRLQRIDPRLCRSIFLNRFSKVLGSFSKEYGEPVICRDGMGFWRRELFPLYKGSRAAAREESSFDWEAVFSFSDIMCRELDEIFKLRVIQIEKMEADDIIAHIVRTDPSKHLVVSRDQDFLQLKALGNMNQWDCLNDKFLEIPEEVTINEFIFEHILRGDGGDGVPNILSDDNYLVNKIRQPPLRKPMIDVMTATYDLTNMSKPDLSAISKTIFESKAFNNAIKKHDLSLEEIERRVRRNYSMVILTEDNPRVDVPVAEVLARTEPRKFDITEVLDYCGQLGLEQFSGNINKMIWWKK